MNRREVLGLAAGAVAGGMAAGKASASAGPKVGDTVSLPSIRIKDGLIRDIVLKVVGQIQDGRFVLEYVDYEGDAILMEAEELRWLHAFNGRDRA